jgi:hypothetical protein
MRLCKYIWQIFALTLCKCKCFKKIIHNNNTNVKCSNVYVVNDLHTIDNYTDNTDINPLTLVGLNLVGLKGLKTHVLCKERGPSCFLDAVGL